MIIRRNNRVKNGSEAAEVKKHIQECRQNICGEIHEPARGTVERFLWTYMTFKIVWSGKYGGKDGGGTSGQPLRLPGLVSTALSRRNHKVGHLLTKTTPSDPSSSEIILTLTGIKKIIPPKGLVKPVWTKARKEAQLTDSFARRARSRRRKARERATAVGNRAIEHRARNGRIRGTERAEKSRQREIVRALSPVHPECNGLTRFGLAVSRT